MMITHTIYRQHKLIMVFIRRFMVIWWFVSSIQLKECFFLFSFCRHKQWQWLLPYTRDHQFEYGNRCVFTLHVVPLTVNQITNWLHRLDRCHLFLKQNYSFSKWITMQMWKMTVVSCGAELFFSVFLYMLKHFRLMWILHTAHG